MSHKYRSNHDSDNEESFILEDNHSTYSVKPVTKQQCSQMKCAPQSQLSFCVPISFDQQLVSLGTGITGITGGTAGTNIPLSLVSTNMSNVRGILKLKFNNSLSRAAYALYVFNAIENNNRITAAHLHIAPAGANNPNYIVLLYGGPARNVNGLLLKGLIDNRSINYNAPSTDPIVNSVASLYQAIQDGDIYVNVHSDQYPGGFIRGQIFNK